MTMDDYIAARKPPKSPTGRYDIAQTPPRRRARAFVACAVRTGRGLKSAMWTDAKRTAIRQISFGRAEAAMSDAGTRFGARGLDDLPISATLRAKARRRWGNG